MKTEQITEKKVAELEIELKEFDDDKYGNEYCAKINCKSCDGTGEDGEPNGYGCEGREETINNAYNKIIQKAKEMIERLGCVKVYTNEEYELDLTCGWTELSEHKWEGVGLPNCSIEYEKDLCQKCQKLKEQLEEIK